MDAIFSNGVGDFAAHLRTVHEVPTRTSVNPKYGLCDLMSYFYSLISFFLIVLGIFITIPALGGSHHEIFSNLGHLWFVGPVCACCGLVIGIRTVMHVRRKQECEILLPERALMLHSFMIAIEADRYNQRNNDFSRVATINELRSSNVGDNRLQQALLVLDNVRTVNLENAETIDSGEPPPYSEVVAMTTDTSSPPPSYTEAITTQIKT